VVKEGELAEFDLHVACIRIIIIIIKSIGCSAVDIKAFKQRNGVTRPLQLLSLSLHLSQ
jgi:hypothetical protein